MSMDEARYRLLDGRTMVVTYDTEAPCRICGLPVVSASMGGTDVCSWCDCGVDRDGSQWDFRRTLAMIGPHSPAAQRPLADLDEDNPPPHIRFEPRPAEPPESREAGR